MQQVLPVKGDEAEQEDVEIEGLGSERLLREA